MDLSLRGELKSPGSTHYILAAEPALESFPRRLDIISFQAGQGHTATANALRDSIAEKHPETTVTVHDFLISFGGILFSKISRATLLIVFIIDGSLRVF